MGKPKNYALAGQINPRYAKEIKSKTPIDIINDINARIRAEDGYIEGSEDGFSGKVGAERRGVFPYLLTGSPVIVRVPEATGYVYSYWPTYQYYDLNPSQKPRDNPIGGCCRTYSLVDWANTKVKYMYHLSYGVSLIEATKECYDAGGVIVNTEFRDDYDAPRFGYYVLWRDKNAAT